MPVTVPVLPTVATAVLLLAHVPPITVLLSAVVLPVHTVAVPLSVPADGAALTVTTLVAALVPQPLVAA